MTWQLDNQPVREAADGEGREMRRVGRVEWCRCPWGLGEWAWSEGYGAGLIGSLTPVVLVTGGGKMWLEMYVRMSVWHLYG